MGDERLQEAGVGSREQGLTVCGEDLGLGAKCAKESQAVLSKRVS